MSRTPTPSAAVAAGLAALLACTLPFPAPAAAQELEPRAFSASPVGANFVGVVYLNSWGSLLFDPTVPITDAEAKLNAATLAYGRTFGIGGVQALAVVAMPYVWGDFNGKLAQNDTSTTRSGIGDLRAKLSVNLFGSPALSPKEFAGAPHGPVVAGVSLTIAAPTGQNYPQRLINIGANRWGFKPEAGVSYHFLQKWYADLYAGAWYFTANPEFYPGTQRREQDPLASVQTHLSYTLARRSWLAADGTWFWGGATQVNGGPPSTRMSNKRVGAVLALGVAARQSVKLSYSYGASTRVGDAFGTAGLAYQLLWF